MNILNELLSTLKEIDKKVSDIDYGYIHYGIRLDPNIVNFNIVNGIAIGELASLDIEYNDGYGSQEVFGLVIFKDKSWLKRGEYDGSEWWEYLTTPPLKEVQSIIEERTQRMQNENNPT